MALFFVFFALGPALCGFSMAYLLRYPADWPAPLTMCVISLLLTLVTQTWGTRRLKQLILPQHQFALSALRWGGLMMGPITGLMAYVALLAQ